MYRNLVKKAKNSKGFTLIELIVVIAIIAILALILVPRFAGFTDDAQSSANTATIRTLETAINVMYADGRLSGNGTFNVNNGTLVPSIPATITYTPATAGDTLQGDLQELVGNNVQCSGGTGFQVAVTAGDVTITEITP